ncbi:hypothetical protein PTSG_05971 [Salpingoeca rosetta]|uniref:Transmembrane protein n=1 Tax=Salpingoeca rosetta (strain ATCC 50818 / BSB-021) TaxID=946362 RepID=F2UDB3_SALR5|nr:uncharacterized protein PTSG_05971 [Salpingoeca rosetta]EGD74608.1 hypothetical protein PTSG_05971 [Salpingoeca rosetta]|eukprot:XP_004992865.1 hypothetical protein PTSG_05971 [Salpingoeca rosetta]
MRSSEEDGNVHRGGGGGGDGEKQEEAVDAGSGEEAGRGGGARKERRRQSTRQQRPQRQPIESSDEGGGNEVLDADGGDDNDGGDDVKEGRMRPQRRRRRRRKLDDDTRGERSNHERQPKRQEQNPDAGDTEPMRVIKAPPRLKPLRIPAVGSESTQGSEAPEAPREHRRPRRPQGKSLASRRLESIKRHGSLPSSTRASERATPDSNEAREKSSTWGSGSTLSQPPADAAWPALNEVDEEDLIQDDSRDGTLTLTRTKTTRGPRIKAQSPQESQQKTYVEGVRAFQATTRQAARREDSGGADEYHERPHRPWVLAVDSYSSALIHRAHTFLLGFLLVHLLVITSVYDDSADVSASCISVDAFLSDRDKTFVCFMDSITRPFTAMFQCAACFCLVSLYLHRRRRRETGQPVTAIWYINTIVYLACIGVGVAALQQELLVGVYDNDLYLDLQQRGKRDPQRPDVESMVQLLRTRNALGLAATFLHLIFSSGSSDDGGSTTRVAPKSTAAVHEHNGGDDDGDDDAQPLRGESAV